MKRVLIESGIKPSEVDVINCHASSTIVEDISETRGVRKIFANKKAFDDLDYLANIEGKDIKEEDLDVN